jgi:hypothetical protein
MVIYIRFAWKLVHFGRVHLRESQLLILIYIIVAVIIFELYPLCAVLCSSAAGYFVCCALLYYHCYRVKPHL